MRRDRAVLVMCTCIALVFWFFVKLSKTYTTTWDFPLRIEAPAERSFLSLPPTTLRSRVEGRGWDLMYYGLFKVKDPVRFQLNNQATLNINGRMLRDRLTEQLASRNIDVLDVNYDYISLSSEPKVERRIPLRAELNLRLLPGYHLLELPHLQPDSVTLSGPESLVQETEYWTTDSLDLQGLKEDYQGLLPVATPQNPVLQITPMMVELRILVEPIVEQSFFAPVEIRNAPDSLVVFPPSVKLTYSAGSSKINLIEPDSFVVFADLDGFERNTQSNTVPLSVENRNQPVQSLRMIPTSVEFFFELSDTSVLNRIVREREQ